MTQKEKIEELILRNKGIIHTSKIVEEGISKTYFYEYVKENGYRPELAPGDTFFYKNKSFSSIFFIHHV